MRGKEDSKRQGQVQTAGVCKKIEELETAQQTRPGSVPGRGKPDRIERENNVKRGRTGTSLCQSFGEKDC